MPSAESQSASPDDSGTHVAAGSGGKVVGDGVPSGGSKDRESRQKAGEEIDGSGQVALGPAEALIDAFDEHVDVARLLRDIREHAAGAHRRNGSADTSGLPTVSSTAETPPLRSVEDGPAPKAPPAAKDTSVVVEQHSGVEGGDGGGGGEAGGAKGSPMVGTTASKGSTRAARKSRQEVEAEAAKEGASGG